MNLNALFCLMTLTFATGISSVASAHARLKNLAMRNNNDGNKEPSRPCGPGTRNINPTVFSPGQKLTVQWEETIDHAGRFEFYFSENADQNFVRLLTVQDNQTGPLPHQYTVELQLPNVQCSNCTLQMIQVMLDNPNNPSNYYSCADIRLTSNGAVNNGTNVPTQYPSPKANQSRSPSTCQ